MCERQMMIVMIKTTNVNIEVAAENPEENTTQGS